MFASSTPNISSPWTLDLPSLDFKKLSNFDLKLPIFDLLNDFLLARPAKESLFSLISFNFPKTFDNLLLIWSCFDGLALSLAETGALSIGFWFSLVWFTIFCSGTAGFCSVTTGASGWTLVSLLFCVVFTSGTTSFVVISVSFVWFFNLSLSSWTSSNHFSKIGIASSKFVVPDDEIFCFPSI